MGRYKKKPQLPFVPGTEGSGVITEVGSETKKYKVGDEVLVTMVVGSHAEEIIVYESQCIRKPAGLTHVEASGLSVGFCTAYHGLIQRGKLTKGETLLVTGAAGGMGIAAIQLGKLIGAKVIAGASTDEKVQAAIDAGADEGINYSTNDLNKAVKNLTDNVGVDVVYEVVGGEIFDKCTRCVNGDGRLLVIGFAGGKIPKIAANLPLIKGYSVVGVRAGAAMQLNEKISREIFDAIEKWGQQNVLPIPVVQIVCDVHSQGIAGIKEAFRDLAQRKAIGKIVLQWRPSSSL
mmetsp:Transcript_66496/g.100200  ORF Transcript_66496/g.100200 Transcript_66496/m.100200 type:complete len:290 (-) Transcript_66496:30-899(-)